MGSGSDNDAPSDRFTPQFRGVATPPEASDQNHVINDAIGEALRRHFRSLAEAPLPERLLVLLSELHAKDADHDK